MHPFPLSAHAGLPDAEPRQPEPAAPGAPAASQPVAKSAPRRPSRLPWLGSGLIVGALLGGLAVSNLYDPRSLGERLDAGLLNVQRSGEAVAEAGLHQAQQMQAALDDTAISARVRTALAADPALSALQIRVSTQDRVVVLEGPAPDAAARDRASVLAQAPAGVRGVSNRLRLPGETAS